MPRKNGEWFDTEMDKLDRWAEDRRAALKADLEELDESIKGRQEGRTLGPEPAREAGTPAEAARLETKRDEAWRAYDSASRDVDRQKDALLDEISHRLQQQTTGETLFCSALEGQMTQRST